MMKLIKMTVACVLFSSPLCWGGKTDRLFSTMADVGAKAPICRFVPGASPKQFMSLFKRDRKYSLETPLLTVAENVDLTHQAVRSMIDTAMVRGAINPLRDKQGGFGIVPSNRFSFEKDTFLRRLMRSKTRVQIPMVGDPDHCLFEEKCESRKADMPMIHAKTDHRKAGSVQQGDLRVSFRYGGYSVPLGLASKQNFSTYKSSLLSAQDSIEHELLVVNPQSIGVIFRVVNEEENSDAMSVQVVSVSERWKPYGGSIFMFSHPEYFNEYRWREKDQEWLKGRPYDELLK